MGNLKKRLSSVLAILFIAMTFLSYIPIRATETIANITFVGVEHSPLIVGDTETFYLSSKGAEKVQYRVFQNKIGTDIWNELTSGYTLSENSDAITTVNSSFKYETGKYQISVWVKKANTEGKFKNKNGSYDSYYVAYLNCVSKDNNNRVYTSGDMNVEKDNYIVGETVKANGINGISGMKAPYTYKLHVYDVSNNIWYLDKGAYRDKEDLTWIATKPGTYVLDVWAMSSNSTLWAKDAKLKGRIYEGWKLKVITVKEKEVIPPVIPEPTYNITDVSLDKTTANLIIAETMELSATINPSNATNKRVTWTSSNEAVATVEGSTGTKANVTAKTAGTATITVITEEGQKTATCTITVVEPQTPPPPTPNYNVTGVSLDKTTANLDIAGLLELTATINPSNATNKNMIWTSSNEAVATVIGTTGTKANVTAITAGTATITVTTVDGQKTANCEITVNAAPIPDTALNATLVVEDYRVTVSVDNIKVANQEITITIHNKEDDKLVFIDQLTADAEGKCSFNTSLDAGNYYGLVRAPQASLTTTLDFEIVQTSIKVEEVSLDKVSANLTIADILELTATINPSNATNKILIWTSSNEAVATVTGTTEANANVIAISAGTATITVTTEDGQKTSTCEISVTAAPIPDAELNATLVVEDYRVTVSVDNIKVANQEITITMHNKADDELVFIDQLTADAEGKCTFNTSLDAGEYYGLVRAPQASLTTALDFEVVQTSIKVEEVSLDKTTANMTTGQVIELIATINPENAANKNLIWTSSNETVATVTSTTEANANVTAVSAGTATITVTTEDGQKTATCEITVTEAPIPDTELNANLVVEDYKVTVLVDNIKVANQEITITMHNKADDKLVFIDQLTADSEGKCAFNTSLDAGKYYGLVRAPQASLTTVLDFEVAEPCIKVKEVSLDKFTANLNIAELLELTATINPDNATNKNVTWISSNEAIAKVTSSTGTKANVEAIGVGTVAIAVKTEDGGYIAVCIVTVTAAPIPDTELNATLVVEDYRVTVSIDKIKVANQEITITMHNKADDKLVFIDQLTADAEGKCTFNTSLDAGKYYGLVRAPQASLTTTLDFEVVHPNIKVVGVSLDKTTANLTIAELLELTATINPENATNKKVTWTSNNETVAIVSGSGEGNATVTAISAGTAIITVTTEDGQKIATCEITITATPTSDSELNATVVVIEDKVTANVDNIKVANQEITIVMRNKENNQLVYIGQLTADSEGKCTFNTSLDAGIYYGFVKASLASLITRLDFEVVVTSAKVVEVSLNKITANMTTGQMIELIATINPENATNKKVNWTSSNEAVATVLGGGEATAAVTAIAAGTTIITVTTEDGQMIATCEITVTALPTSIQSLISQLWLEKIANVRKKTFNERFTLPNFM